MRTIQRLLVLAVLTLLVTTLPAQEYHGKAKDIKQILTNIDRFSSYYVNGETENLVACYTEDGKILPGNSDVRTGPEALRKWWAVREGVTVLRHKITPLEIRITGKYAHDHGYYEGETMNAVGEKSAFKGKYVIVWQKVDKQWKIYLDMWNSLPRE
jgi:ketosteroid isomerase-like protein